MIFESDFEVTEEQKEKYIEVVKEKNNGSLEDILSIKLEEDGDHVKIHYKKNGEPKFERIRRINKVVPSLQWCRVE